MKATHGTEDLIFQSNLDGAVEYQYFLLNHFKYSVSFAVLACCASIHPQPLTRLDFVPSIDIIEYGCFRR